MNKSYKSKPKKNYRDKDGNDIPAKYVAEHDRTADDMARAIYNRAQELQHLLMEFKTQLLEDAELLREKKLAEFNVQEKPNARGGMTISTLDKEIQVELSIGQRVTFDERIDMAKLKFFEYIENATKGADPVLREIIETAFQTPRGKLDSKNVLRLLQIKNNDAVWMQGIELLKESMSTTITKRYIEFRKRDQEGKYINLVLDIASI